MSQKIERPYNLVLALVILIGLGGVVGVSYLNVKVSVLGVVIVMIALLESALIVGGIALLSCRQASLGAVSDSN